MSSLNKDPLEKRDTSSESSESHSDSEVIKAEETLDQQRIDGRLTKDDSGESKPLDSPNQVGTLTSKYDPLNEPIAGPSGLQEPRLESSDAEFKVESLSDPQKEKNLEAKDIDENIGAKMLEGESHTNSEGAVESKGLEGNIDARMAEEDSDSTSSTSLFILSSTGETTSSMLQEKSTVSGSSGLGGEVDHPKLPTDAGSMYMTESSESSSSRRFRYASDSAHTSWDVSEIRSEIADISTEGGVHSDAPEVLEKDQSSRHASAVGRPSSETSETNISELQDDDSIPPPRFQPDSGKKRKMVASKSSPALQSSSESIEPKSSSTGESQRKGFSDIKSSPEVQECSKSMKGRKSRQKPGLLHSLQLPAMSSKDSVTSEEEDRTSRLRQHDTELIENKDPTPEKMETTLDKGSEGVAETTERSESKPAIESSDLVGGSEAGGTSKEHEQSSEVPELERSVRKSKRETTLSSSTSSDKEQSSSPPKASTSRPKKRARYDKMPAKTRRTRHDSGGSDPKSVSLSNLQESEPTSSPDSSDYTPSFSSSETTH